MSDAARDGNKHFGFGLMRLPKKGIGIDIAQTSEMVDLFLQAGFTYFDTAYVYPGSEAAIKKALVDRYPRDAYTLATKLNAGMALNEKMAKQEFETSLERTGAGYFDYYLLHAIMRNNYEKYDKYGIWDFAHEKMAEGKIRHYGFSFHADPELLDEILTAHPDVDFVQLQINYMDWENPKVTARANYEVARKHGKRIVIMEPVKGGKLANPPKQVKKMMDAYNPNASYASWAIRFAASLDGVLAVLSGMSNVEQMRDNLSFMEHFQPLNADEQRIIQKAQKVLGHSAAIPCTSCHYCTPGCPKQIPIPEIFTAFNKDLANGQLAEAKEAYQEVTSEGHRASDCIVCRQCEKQCPQHIDITDQLKRAAARLEV